MLSLDGISFRYRRSRTWALERVECELRSTAVAVLGPNGAGKSTLFGVLSTVLRPSSGSFRAGGHELGPGRVGVDAYRSVIGVLPQDFRALGGYSCREFLEYVAWLRRVPLAQTAAQISSALDAVALGDASGKRIRELSGGMRQRLGLAQALVSRPALLLLDEPTVGLDPGQRVEFLELLDVIARDTTVCLATHLVEDVAAFAEEVLLLTDGRVRFAGSTAAFCGVSDPAAVDGPAVQRAYFERAGRGPV